MFKKITNLFTAITFVAVTSLFGFSATAQTPIVIKLSHVVAENTPKGQASLKFKELAEKNYQEKYKYKYFLTHNYLVMQRKWKRFYLMTFKS